MQNGVRGVSCTPFFSCREYAVKRFFWRCRVPLAFVLSWIGGSRGSGCPVFAAEAALLFAGAGVSGCSGRRSLFLRRFFNFQSFFSHMHPLFVAKAARFFYFQSVSRTCTAFRRKSGAFFYFRSVFPRMRRSYRGWRFLSENGVFIGL